MLQEALSNLTNLRLDQAKPFRRFAGIIDGVSEAVFAFDPAVVGRLAHTDVAAPVP